MKFFKELFCTHDYVKIGSDLEGSFNVYQCKKCFKLFHGGLPRTSIVTTPKITVPNRCSSDSKHNLELIETKQVYSCKCGHEYTVTSKPDEHMSFGLVDYKFKKLSIDDLKTHIHMKLNKRYKEFVMHVLDLDPNHNTLSHFHLGKKNTKFYLEEAINKPLKVDNQKLINFCGYPDEYKTKEQREVDKTIMDHQVTFVNFNMDGYDGSKVVQIDHHEGFDGFITVTLSDGKDMDISSKQYEKWKDYCISED